MATPSNAGSFWLVRGGLMLVVLLAGCAGRLVLQPIRHVTIGGQVVTTESDRGALYTKVQNAGDDGRAAGPVLAQSAQELVGADDDLMMFETSANAWLRWRRSQGPLGDPECNRVLATACERIQVSGECADVAMHLCDPDRLGDGS